MPYFPVYLDLREQKCLVVGAGEVGLRKMRSLAASQPAEVLIVEPEPDSDLLELVSQSPNLVLARRSFQTEDLDDCFLVIASTADPELNRKISGLCQGRGILCNIVDRPEMCSFILPALFRRGELSIAVSTQGASPALSSRVKERLADCFGPEYALWTRLLRLLRPKILELGLDGEENKAVFRSLCREEVRMALLEWDWKELERILRASLPRQLHSEIEGVLHELA